jgi:L-fuconolactonase
MPDVIDAHVHFWDRGNPFDDAWLDAPGLEAIAGPYLPDHLRSHREAVGVDRLIVVQTLNTLNETRWLLSLADRHASIAGVVGWIDLTDPDCESQLLALRGNAKFVGVRHLTHNEPDDDFIVRPDVLRGLAILETHGVPFDLLFFVKHLRHAAELARRFPALPLIVDHLAKPDIRNQTTDDWWPDLTATASFPNVYCKLSGMVTEADHELWTPEDLRPYVQTALDLFGPSRCLFGSDWPVCELAAGYEAVFNALHRALGPISADEQAEIFGGTAARVYGIAGSGSPSA